jgi:hypothetical protein
MRKLSLFVIMFSLKLEQFYGMRLSHCDNIHSVQLVLTKVELIDIERWKYSPEDGQLQRTLLNVSKLGLCFIQLTLKLRKKIAERTCIFVAPTNIRKAIEDFRVFQKVSIKSSSASPNRRLVHTGHALK